MEAAKIFLKERIEFGDSIIFVDEQETEILSGFTQLYPLFSSTRMKKLWLLNDLYVNSSFRGKGISVALINKAKELARETSAAGLMLETAKTNEIGNNLYSKTGFELDSEHNMYSWDV
jgi:GNAT superfamily N-acetyltransferase